MKWLKGIEDWEGMGMLVAGRHTLTKPRPLIFFDELHKVRSCRLLYRFREGLVNCYESGYNADTLII